MKTLIKTAFSAAGLFLCLAVLVIESKAQCVQCVPAPPGFACVPSTNGGGACTTEHGNCTLSVPCPVPNNDRTGNGSDKGPCLPTVLKNPQVKISNKIIQEVANSDPKMAIVLVEIREIMVEFREAKIFLSPLELTSQDVISHFLQTHDSRYFKEIKERTGELLANGGTPILYDVSISEDLSDSAILTIRSTDNRVAFPSLELNLKKATLGKGKNQSDGFKVSGWRFK